MGARLKESYYIKKHAEALFRTSKEVCLEVNSEYTKSISISYLQSAGHNHNIKAANKSFENVAKL